MNRQDYIRTYGYGYMIQKLETELSPYILHGNPSVYNVVDVRTPEEFAVGHVPGAVNLPFDGRRNSFTSPNYASFFDTTRPNVFYCSKSTCVLSLMAAIKCAEIGRRADGSKKSTYLTKTLIGNYENWAKENFNVEVGTPSKL